MSGDNRRYSKSDAIEYVAYLGCWRFMDHVGEAQGRDDPEDYRRRLIQLIETNRERVYWERVSGKPGPGTWETVAAQQILDRLNNVLKPA